MFIAHYIGTTPYHKTVWADDLNEAVKQAEKWIRKGYKLLSVTKKGLSV